MAGWFSRERGGGGFLLSPSCRVTWPPRTWKQNAHIPDPTSCWSKTWWCATTNNTPWMLPGPMTVCNGDQPTSQRNTNDMRLAKDRETSPASLCDFGSPSRGLSAHGIFANRLLHLGRQELAKYGITILELAILVL